MQCRTLQAGCVFGFALTVSIVTIGTAWAAPRINNVSLRGLQAGGITTLVIEGSELLPEPRLWFSAPVASQTIKDGATAERVEMEIALAGQTPSGIYLLRAASASGISEPVAMAVDTLPQIPFAAQLPTLNVAMTGAIEGSTVLATSLVGKQGQQLVVEVESRRLGANLNPVLRLYDARRVQLAWSQGLAALVGDARLVATLPADGYYTIELHDGLFRGASPGFFRLKVGEFRYANLVYPLAVEQGGMAALEFLGGNFPDPARSSASWPLADGRSRMIMPAPWPSDVGPISGSRPAVLVSSHGEIVEAPPDDKPQEISAAPVGINGRISGRGEQDRYRLAVTAGQKLRFDVLARQAGSPLDGVLAIQNEQGAPLAENDDRQDTCDPRLDFAVPENTSAVVVALRDLQGRGGPDYVYRIGVTPLGQPDFSLSLTDGRFLVPKDGAALARVVIERSGYNGPVRLQFPNLPPGLSITGDEIPAGATQALVTLAAGGVSPAQSVTTVLGTSSEPNTSMTRAALPPQNAVNEYQPWLRQEVAVAVTTPSSLALAWDSASAETKLAVGTSLPVKLRVNRAQGASGPVRLALLTTQVAPRKKVKVNNQDQEVDDVERTIRFQAAPTIPADQSEVAATILVPVDLPHIAYDLAIQAELLAADNKTVLASAVTGARRLTATTPLLLELASQQPIEVRAGVGPTGKLAGKIHRAAGFALPVTVRVSGLPKGVSLPTFEVPADKAEFEFPLAVRYGTVAGDLANVKLVATSQIDPKQPASTLSSNEVPLALKVVPGDKPPPEKPLAIFEDQVEFLANLTQGGGQASLIADQKYSGLVSIRVTPDQRFNPALPGLAAKIREFPGPGEFRYLRFAWKKQGGAAICLQLNHDGKWGPAEGSPAKFRYHAGPMGEVYGGSVGVDGNLPGEFAVVTRDLFADFGEFTLNGLALSPVDGEFALFDHIYLGTQPEDFDLVKP
jgi:hypothetical protein